MKRHLRKQKKVDVEFDKESNTFTVNRVGASITLLLSAQFCDLNKDITIRFPEDGKVVRVKPKAYWETLVKTLVGRGDPRYMFEASISLVKTEDGNWVQKS